MSRRDAVVRAATVAILALLLAPTVEALTARRSAAQMTRAATAFLTSLDAGQREKVQFAFEDAERFDWHYIPRARKGLPYKEMTETQRDLARGLLRAGLSQRGLVKTDAIIELELVLREMGQNPAVRDPELYYFSLFGTPGDDRPWGWRFEGHHLSLNFTIVGRTTVATAPAFFGANPAEVRVGSRRGLRALAAEEDLARDLILALDPAQRAAAIIAVETPRDVITGNAARVDPLGPVGIPVARLRHDQAERLFRLIDEYLGRMADDIAAERRARLEESDFDRITFAWAGSVEPGQPHYYRVQGPTFLIEYDNTQNEANHIHTVWRDFDGDFGRDLLREHYARAPHPH